MGRIRSIKPELIANLKFASLSDGAARLLLSLKPLVDDEGHCPAGPSYIAGQVFFAKPRSLAVIAKLLGELEAARFIVRYEAEDQPYLEIVGFRGEAREAPPGFTAERGVLSEHINKPQRPHFPLPSWFGSRNDSGNDSRPDPNSEQRPASGEAELDREQIAKLAGADSAAPGRLSAWRPPPGGKAETEARRRVTAGEISAGDVAKCWEYCESAGIHRKQGADAIAETLIRKQRPARDNARGEPASDEAYEESPF